MSRGEVWWYEDPASAPRPHLILTRDEAIPVLNEVLAVPATRTTRGIATEVPLDATDGMPEACALTLDNLVPILTSGCTTRITLLSPERMERVCQALAAATGCRVAPPVR